MELCRKKEEGEEKRQDVKKQSIGFRVAKEGKPEYCKVRGQGQAQDRDGAAGDRWCGWYLTTSCNLQQQGGSVRVLMVAVILCKLSILLNKVRSARRSGRVPKYTTTGTPNIAVLLLVHFDVEV